MRTTPPDEDTARKPRAATAAKGTWHTRGLTSLLTLAGFLVMSVTGLVLYMVPEGRIANWVEWSFLRLTKGNWGDIHILSSLLFIVAGAFHLYFNWKPLMNYLRDKALGGIKLKKELSVSVAALLVVWIGALYRIPPLSYLLDLNHFVKSAWVTTKDQEPPFGHAEDVTLAVFCKKTEIPFAPARDELVAKGWKQVDADRTLAQIAAANATSPQAVYLAIRHLEPAAPIDAPAVMSTAAVEELFADSSVGSKSLEDVAARLKLEPSVLVDRLRRKKIEADQTASIKSAASQHGLVPLELLKAALVEDYVPPPKP